MTSSSGVDVGVKGGNQRVIQGKLNIEEAGDVREKGQKAVLIYLQHNEFLRLVINEYKPWWYLFKSYVFKFVPSLF